ncbi:unnamed protein product [Strongylus vulgaris]|uniref:Uncharacterized protein n=1 Tax=Strongylus vulgaris TaxID=40348 RepID=A0A3P7IPL6_STRVU|nr:unnamed protein product [Strongylus vulgaris]
MCLYSYTIGTVAEVCRLSEIASQLASSKLQQLLHLPKQTYLIGFTNALSEGTIFLASAHHVEAALLVDAICARLPYHGYGYRKLGTAFAF